jgi:16S rRNA (cytidine1402-2'-O)-methyltransferase
MSSGMNGQSFAFNGYLPIDKKQRTQALLKLQRLSLKEKQTQIFIETPYRNEALLQEILKTLDPNTLLCVACDLTLPTEFISTSTVLQWKKRKVDLNKRPAIFLIEGSY